MTGSSHELSLKKKRELDRSIKSFKTWLCKIKKLPQGTSDSIVIFPRPTSADWIMKVDGSEVRFNSYITSRCSFDCFRLVVLHECFHLFVQHLPNKEDAKMFRDDFGPGFMQLFDVEADYYTAMFFKEVEHVSLVEMFDLYREVGKIFADPTIRQPKLARFIGSILSIANAYFKNPRAKQTTKENELYLPNVSNILTEETIHVFLLTKNHFAYGKIKIGIHDFVRIRECYTASDVIGRREYVEELLAFASKALQMEIPQLIHRGVYALPSVTPIRSRSVGQS